MLSNRSWNYFYQTSSFSLILNLICSPGTVFQQSRRLFPFLLLPTQALCCGDMERDAWPVQHCASLGMELLCAQSFSHCFGLYGENVCALKGPHLSKCAYCTNEHCTLRWENNCAAWSWYKSVWTLSFLNEPTQGNWQEHLFTYLWTIIVIRKRQTSVAIERKNI